MKYPSDLTTKQWNKIKHHFASEKRGAHLAKHSKRRLVDAVLYVTKTGCQWRMLPKNFPNYVTVWSFYRRAIASGLWEKILAELVSETRVKSGRNACPTYVLIDSQSVKTTGAAENRGVDGGKKSQRS